MTSGTSHYDDELHELLDGRLVGELLSEVEAHLKSCDKCGKTLERLRWIRETVAENIVQEELPAEVESALSEMLDREDGKALPGSETKRRRWALAAAAAVVAGIVGVVMFPSREMPDFPAAVATDYRLYRQAELTLVHETSSTEDMESFFAERGIPFDTRVFDLAMMDYGVRGGRVHEVASRQSALFVYQAEDGRTLVCQMYEGHVDELGGERQVRVHNEIDFYIYRVGEITLVFWQEGRVICVLASDIAAEEVVQLAFAKAIKV